MKITIISFLTLIVCTSCSRGWNQEKKEKFYKECVNAQSEIEGLQSHDIEASCSCSIDEFIAKVSWGEYQKMLRGELSKGEEAFFSNKTHLIYNKIKEKCNFPQLPK